MRRSILRSVFYLLLFLVLGVFFFALTFPADRLASLVNARLSNLAGGALAVEKVRYRFPLSLTADTLDLEAGGRTLRLGHLTVSPRLLTLLGKEQSWDAALSGPWGRIPLAVALTKEGGWKVSGAARDLDLSKHPELIGLPLSLAGSLSFRVDLSGVKGTFEGASGAGDITLSQASLAGKTLENIGLSSLSFSRAAAGWSLERGILSLRDAKVEGDLMGEVTGTVQTVPARPLASVLDITLALRPSLAAKDRLGPLFAMLGGNPASGSVVVKLAGPVLSPSFALSSGR